ncbi:hypothetical protein F4678DRAFT_376201 [Xylaria arbuscula]|nr:hypothetical protein F4678DRAFT_376201 [Xylaria arbuscula]
MIESSSYGKFSLLSLTRGDLRSSRTSDRDHRFFIANSRTYHDGRDADLIQLNSTHEKTMTLTTISTRSLSATALPPAAKARVGGTTRPRRSYSSQPPRGPNTTVKFWPFLAIIIVGTGAFAYVSKSRAGQGRAPIARNEIPNK